MREWPAARGGGDGRGGLSSAGGLHHAAFVILHARYYERRFLQLANLHLNGRVKVGGRGALGRQNKSQERGRSCGRSTGNKGRGEGAGGDKHTGQGRVRRGGGGAASQPCVGRPFGMVRLGGALGRMCVGESWQREAYATRTGEAGGGGGAAS